MRSPLLANVLLDEVDKELERRGHCFVRYADDANVYVRSCRAGERVMALLRRLYGRLKLKINEAKSAVAHVEGRKFLGFSFWLYKGKVRCKVADKALATFKQRVRQLLRPSRCASSLSCITSTSRTARCGPACRVVWQLRLASALNSAAWNGSRGKAWPAAAYRVLRGVPVTVTAKRRQGGCRPEHQ